MAHKKSGQLKRSSRKIGRNLKKPAYKRYLAENRRNKNKARKIVRYMKKFPNWKPLNLSKEVEMLVERMMN